MGINKEQPRRDYQDFDNYPLDEQQKIIDKLIQEKTQWQELIDAGDSNYDLVELSNKCRDLNKEIRKKAGYYIKEKYLQDTPYKDVDLLEVLADLGISNKQLDEIGIYFDEDKRIRLKHPEDDSIPGSWEDKDVLKALIVGAVQARDGQYSKLELLKDVYRYLGLPFEYNEDQNEEEFIVGLLNKINNKIKTRKILTPIILTMLLLMKDDISVDAKKIQGDAFLDNYVPTKEQVVYPNVYYLTEQDKMGIGDVAKKILKSLGKEEGNYSQDQLYELIKVLAESNNIAVPELGIIQGKDDEKLEVGLPIYITGQAWELAKQIAGVNVEDIIKNTGGVIKL